MQTKRFYIGLAVFCAALLTSTAWAQNTGSITQAFQTASKAVSPDLEKKVVSVYGIGSTPMTIQKWYIIFYDPSVPSHGRAVLVENNSVTKTYPANGGTTYSANLTFDPARINDEGPALAAAQAYASDHKITYTSVTALLKVTSVDKPFCWRIGLVNNHTVKGYVMVKAIDDTIAGYVPASSASGKKTASAEDGAKGFANDVKNTFLGIGGDLEQFFTGERTVDR